LVAITLIAGLVVLIGWRRTPVGARGAVIGQALGDGIGGHQVELGLIPLELVPQPGHEADAI